MKRDLPAKRDRTAAARLHGVVDEDQADAERELEELAAIGITTLEVIEKEGLLQNAEAMGRVLMDGFKRELAGVAGVKDIRGMGLMIGIELDRPCGDIVKRALEAGLVTNVTADKVIRLLPALVIRRNEAQMLVEILAPLIRQFLAQTSAAAAA